MLETYEIGGRTAAGFLAMTIVLVEALSGGGLVARREAIRRIGSAGALAVAVGWTILGAQAFARGLPLENCGCFGVHLAQPLRWWILVEDAELVALARWVHSRDVPPAGDRRPDLLVVDGPATQAEVGGSPRSPTARRSANSSSRVSDSSGTPGPSDALISR